MCAPRVVLATSSVRRPYLSHCLYFFTVPVRSQWHAGDLSSTTCLERNLTSFSHYGTREGLCLGFVWDSGHRGFFFPTSARGPLKPLSPPWELLEEDQDLVSYAFLLDQTSHLLIRSKSKIKPNQKGKWGSKPYCEDNMQRNSLLPQSSYPWN